MADPQHWLITGASSGIGRLAAERLQQQGHRLTVICRSQQRADQTLGWLTGESRLLLADLADLDQVQAIGQALLQRDDALDGMLLNAGLQYAGHRQVRWSAQSLELTIAVNHMAHQRLVMDLLPLLLQSAAPRLVITASEVHNPASGGGRVGRPAGLGDLSGLKKHSEMVNGERPFDADKAYKDSKLCNLLMGRHLAQLHPQLPVICWSPGLVIPRGRDGFFRNSREANPLGQALFGFVARDLLRLTEHPQRAAELLERLVLDPAMPLGFSYWSNTLLGPGRHRFERAETSAEAADEGKAGRLWQVSEQLIQ